jgi:hypothetical protein
MCQRSRACVNPRHPREVPRHAARSSGGALQLTFHRDKKEMDVYALVIMKGGHKLKESEWGTHLDRALW